MLYKTAVKKPIPVKVIQLTAQLWVDIYTADNHSIKINNYKLEAAMVDEPYLYPAEGEPGGVIPVENMVKVFFVNTLEDVDTGKLHRAKIDDWLIIGVAGEIYACDKSIFEETYDIIKEGVER